jgi:hypothetical protein
MEKMKDAKALIRKFRLKRGVEFRRAGARSVLTVYRTSIYPRLAVKELVVSTWEGSDLCQILIPVSVEEAVKYLEEGRT